MFTCEKCKKEFLEDWRKDKRSLKKNPIPRFCSQSCANKRERTEEVKAKISLSLKRKDKRFCSKCNKEISYNNVSGVCKLCKDPAKSKSKIIEDFRKRRKKFLVEYKGGKCEICGYSKSVTALEFHHKDSNQKDFGISSGDIKNLKRSLEEVDKCILVCANCHRELHEEIRGIGPS